MGPQFHETEFGRRFFGKQLPELTKAINRLAEAKEKENNIQSEAEVPFVVDREAFDEALQYLVNNSVEAEDAKEMLTNICFILLGTYRISE